MSQTRLILEGYVPLSKVCTKCKKWKTLDSYRIKKGYHENVCKQCRHKDREIRRKTIEGRISTIYENQKKHSSKRGHPMPNYSRQDLKEWLLKDDIFTNLHKIYIDSGYDKNLVPTTDRKDNYLPYTLDNIQVMTWEENFRKAHSDLINGKLDRNNKRVEQYTLEGEYIKTYHSGHAAGRALNLCFTSICTCARGERKEAGGFKWKYKK